MTATLTLQDIADLADVRRPVVSMWRKRPRAGGEEIPFPQAARLLNGVEHFDSDEVVDWLRRTGRGNNPAFSTDVATVAVPPGADADGLAALLCLAALSGTDLAGLTHDDLVDLADEWDPADDCLHTEITSLASDESPALARYVDELVASSYSASDALDRLDRGRLTREAPTHGFAQSAVDLVADVTAALATQLSDEPVYLVAASTGQSRLALLTARAWPEGSCRSLVITGDAPEARRHRRAARVHGMEIDTQLDGVAVTLLSVMELPAADALDAVDELQLSLPDDQVAVVIGPASVLCDGLSDARGEAARAAILRTGKLRVAARLPRGWWLRAPRQALGLWVFGTPTAQRLEDRKVAVMDLSGTALDTFTRSAITTDVVASLGDLNRHSFAFARVLPTSRLISSRVVVPSGAVAPTSAAVTPAERAVRIEELVESVQAPVLLPEIVARPTDGDASRRQPTVDELIAVRVAALRRGARLDLSRATPDGSVRVFMPEAGDAGLGFDPLELEHHNSRAQRTEPGDVVFTHTPRPTARVDAVGGSVVPYPARILQLGADAPVGPYLLAWMINQQPETAREWRGWRVPVLPEQERDRLEATLRALDRARNESAQRCDAVTVLANELIDGVVAGAITLEPNGPEGS